MTADGKGSTATLLAMTAARQALSTTSIAQARLEPAAAASSMPTEAGRVTLFAAGGRAGVHGSFAPEAAALIGQESDR